MLAGVCANKNSTKNSTETASVLYFADYLSGQVLNCSELFYHSTICSVALKRSYSKYDQG